MPCAELWTPTASLDLTAPIDISTSDLDEILAAWQDIQSIPIGSELFQLSQKYYNRVSIDTNILDDVFRISTTVRVPFFVFFSGDYIVFLRG